MKPSPLQMRADAAYALLRAFANWSDTQTMIKGVALVGSFAKGNFHEDSDIDLIIITEDQAATLRAIEEEFSYEHITSLKIEYWGLLTSLRVLYVSGLEVEYGVVTE